jgi:7-cyano-7-deazaguanine synthase in queuosine biosynthesis
MNNLVFYNKETILPTEPISVAWSGGIDSTYALKWLLENTEHPIYAYFIGMNSPGIFEEQRIQVELKACFDMLDELKSIRDFQFEVLKADFPAATARVASLISIVQQVNFRRKIYNIFTGIMKEEADKVFETETEVLHILSLSYEFSDTIATAWENFTRTADSAYKLHNKKREFTRLKVLPYENLGNKTEYARYLGISLVEKTFTCANTEWLLYNTTPCNVCIRCTERQQALNILREESI